MLYLFEKNLYAFVFSCSSPPNNKTTNNGKINRTPTLHAVVRLLQRPTAAEKGYTDKGEIKYSVPVSIEPPLTPEAGSNIHEVFPPTASKYVHSPWNSPWPKPTNGS